MSLRHETDEEMSMDEILASIRRHVTNTPEYPQKPKAPENPSKSSIDFSASTYGVHLSNDSRIDVDMQDDEEDDIYTLTEAESVETAVKQNIQSPKKIIEEPESPTIAHFRQTSEKRKEDKVTTPQKLSAQMDEKISMPHNVTEKSEEESDALLSNSSVNAVIGSLGNLMSVQKQQKQEANEYSKAIESLVSNILKGILRDWANEHLPVLVEKIVKDEIRNLVNNVKLS